MTDPTPSLPRAWWQHPALLIAVVLAGAIPLLLPAIPPLTDLPGHIARYHIELNLDRSPLLQRYYTFRWALAGNLGIDLLIVPMAKLFGLAIGIKLLVILIPMMMIAGLLATAREIHGTVPPTAYFALPLAYCWPFQFGFVNFALSASLCFLALALWLRLGRTGRTKLRALLFIPLACLVWLAHIYGWGLLGVLAFAAETAMRRDSQQSWIKAIRGGALACTPLMLPFVLMLAWRSGPVAGDTGDWDVGLKLAWLTSILRERYQAWDLASAALLFTLLLAALRGRDLRLSAFGRIALTLLFLLFLAIPRVLIGSGYADMRLAPMLVAVGLIAIRGDTLQPRTARLIAIAALGFFAARIAVTTFVFDSISSGWQRQLAAIEHIDPGSRVLALDHTPCINTWATGRFDHISSLAVPRRDVFTNGQFVIPGALMLGVTYRAGAPFVIDPSHLLRPAGCGRGQKKLRLAVETFPRAFDYLWLVDVPSNLWPKDPGLVPIWQDGNGILFRNPASLPVSETPTGD